VNPITSFLENKSRTSVQFIKYGIAGAIATGIHFLIFAFLNETVLPADIHQNGSQRGWNFFWSFSIAFFLANIFGYFANRRWVFQAGRHSRFVEVGLFYVIAAIAFILGTPLGAWLVANFPLNEYLVYLIAALASVLVNFLGRKLIVFRH
jgi:putative flippase GtrA